MDPIVENEEIEVQIEDVATEVGKEEETVVDEAENAQPKAEETELTAAQVLKECEAYISRLIFIINGGSMLVDNMILMLFSYHLKENLNASTSEIGVALFFNVVLSPIRQYGIPYLAENEKTKAYFSYDRTTTVRLLISVGVLLVLSTTESKNVFIFSGVLNCLFSVSNETTQGCISLLLPEREAIKWQNPAVMINIITVILSAVFIAVVLSFTKLQILFYMCALIYFLLFIYSALNMWGKDAVLIERQLRFYDSKFFKEKMLRKVRNSGNKYRRKTSVAMSIQKFLTAAQSNGTDGVSAALEEAFARKVEFPIYEIKARQEMSAADETSSGAGPPEKRSVLSPLEWTLVVLLWLIGCFCTVPLFIGNAFTLLYLMERFPNESVSTSSLMVGSAPFFGLIAILLYMPSLRVVKWIIFRADSMTKLNDKEEIQANCCLLVLSAFGLVSILWVDVLPFYHLSWAVMFVWGYCVICTPSILSIVVLILLKSEHLQSRLIAVYNGLSNVSGAVGVLLVGLTWQTSIHSFVYAINACALLVLICGILMLILTSRLQVKLKKVGKRRRGSQALEIQIESEL